MIHRFQTTVLLPQPLGVAREACIRQVELLRASLAGLPAALPVQRLPGLLTGRGRGGLPVHYREVRPGLHHGWGRLPPPPPVSQHLRVLVHRQSRVSAARSTPVDPQHGSRVGGRQRRAETPKRGRGVHRDDVYAQISASPVSRSLCPATACAASQHTERKIYETLVVWSNRVRMLPSR